MLLFEFGFSRRDIGADFFDDLELLVGVNPRLRLVSVVEKGKEAEVFRVRDGVELVRVALRALEREAEDRGSHRIHAVEHALQTPLLWDDRPLLIDHAITQEPSGHLLVLSFLGQQVAGDLFGNEAVVGLIRIERPNHPVAPRPLLTRQILLEAVAVRVARRIEPVPRPLFTEAAVG